MTLTDRKSLIVKSDFPAGQVAASYYLGPLGTIGSSYGGDALNSLLIDGTMDNFSFENTTQNLGVELFVGQLGIGNKVGSLATKKIKNELFRNMTSSLISQNVDGVLSEVGISSWKEQSLVGGVKSGLNSYSKNWWKYSLSGLSQGHMETKDTRTRQKLEFTERAQAYYKKNSTMTGFSYQSTSWLNSIYDLQIIIAPVKNPRLYSPARNY